MTCNRLWNLVLKLGLFIWLYSGKLLLTLFHALWWELELPYARRDYIRSILSIGSIIQLKKALSLHFNYRNDPLGGAWDFYYLPHITWALRRGDCDDYALMAADALARSGIPAIMVSLIHRKIAQSHVIVIYQYSKRWYWSEVGFWYDVSFPDPEAALLDAANSLGGARASFCQVFVPINKTGGEFNQ
jgi:hypothetical protein